MNYMLLIYSDETAFENSTREEMGALLQQYGAYTAEMQAAGAFIAGEGLQPTAAATTVQVRAEKTLTIHGPFAETKEQLGGFYLIDCANLDEAIAWAAKCPTAKHGQIEIRPVMNYG